MYAFEMERPKTLEEAVAALKQEDAQALSGGQTLIPTLKARLAMPARLVSLKGIDSLRGIEATGDRLRIGGGATHGEIARAAADSFPGLSGLAGRIGDPAVRNRGTIGGSIANNDPAACYPAAALAVGATIVTDRREIAAEEFFQGMFLTALEEGEIITRIDFPVPEASNYQKFEQPASRFALVGVFVARMRDGAARVGVTGASEQGVFRWSEAEEALSANFAPDAVQDITPDAAGMISDLHGSAEYRAHLTAVMTRRAVRDAR